jgi:hypothetical protein
MSGVRWLLWSCLMAIPAAALAQDEQFAGKRIVPVVQEPRHRVVYQNGRPLSIGCADSAGRYNAAAHS